jgi:hypothetical protein
VPKGGLEIEPTMRATAKTAKGSQNEALDPLYVIFEQHLYNFQDSDQDRKTFIANVVNDYLTYLRRKKIAIPRSLEHAIVEELATQVNTMLVKKIYGCYSIQDYQKSMAAPHRDTLRRRARSRYSKLAK